MRIERQQGRRQELGKRCKIPFFLYHTCSCGEETVLDFLESGYLEYPIPGEVVTLECECLCGIEFELKVLFDVSLTVVPS